MRGSTPSARARELFRYHQPSEPSGETSHCNFGKTENPQASANPCLTAFAQLGALRLNAKRGIISLSTRDTEYIIAEAGRTLSLQADDDKYDKLWHGVGTLHCNSTIGPDIADILSEPDSPPYLIIKDLSTDKRFSSNHVVTAGPRVRFLASAELRTAENVVIGSYTVVDDTPREGLTEQEIEFLVDMGATVMDYLDAGRIKMKSARSEMMFSALRLFVEGNSSLRDWWLNGGYKMKPGYIKKSKRKDIDLAKEADDQFGVQDPPDRFFAIQGIDGLRSAASPPEMIWHVQGKGRPSIPNSRDSYGSSVASTEPPNIFKSEKERHNSEITVDSSAPSLEAGWAQLRGGLDSPNERIPVHVPRQPQEALLSSELQRVFARASNLIREAIGIDGAVFLDASLGSFGNGSDIGNVVPASPGAFRVDGTLETTSSSDDERKRTTNHANCAPNEPASFTSQPNGNLQEKCSNILGYSTRSRSSIKGHAPYDEHRGLPEKALRKLLKRYPHGNVFNFEGDGAISSGESDNSSRGVETPSVSGNRNSGSLDANARIIKKKLAKLDNAAALLAVFPNARSVAWYPLWDHSKERWFAGLFLWSTSDTRFFCPSEDISYMATFGNSIMAEVARLSALADTKMKTDFISSISHELRSPLHGVLASVEFLQETEMNDVQTEMVDNIHSSGKVLLDTINHVLDFSKVNKKQKQRTKAGRIGKRSRPGMPERKSTTFSVANDVEDVCVLTEEVVDSIYAGRRIYKNKSKSISGHHRTGSTATASSIGDIAVEPQLTVVVDIAWRSNWNFEVDAGAWRRILMNLFSNAMKYTETGFVKVSLKTEDDLISPDSRPQSILVLTVTDSGKGISKDFLKNQLYKPFSQEDSLSVGTGLGLSIVRQIVRDLGGHIHVTSEPDSGTEVKVQVPLMPPPVQPAAPLGESLISEVRLKTNGLKVALEGFNTYPEISDIPTGILSAEADAMILLQSSMSSLMVDWFGMKAVCGSESVVSDADVKILMHSANGDGESLADKVRSLRNRPGPRRFMLLIVLCTSYPETTKFISEENIQACYVQQPYGPHRLTQVLYRAFCEKSFEVSHHGDSTVSLPMSSTVQTGIQTPIVLDSPQNGIAKSSAVNGIGTPTQNQTLPRGLQSPIVMDSSKNGIMNSSAVNGITTAMENEKPQPRVRSPIVTDSPKNKIPESSPENDAGTAVANQIIQEGTQKTPSVSTEQPKPSDLEKINSSNESLDKFRILLVEDNEINLKLLVAYMRKLKLDHSTAINGLEALNAYKEASGDFSVIFMDISMPVMTGIESARHIRQFERDNGLRPVALIALTGAANPSSRQEALNNGIDLYLTKPVPMKSLKVILDGLKENEMQDVPN